MTAEMDREGLRAARPVLFLDVDGVLNDLPFFKSKDRNRGPYSSIDPQKIKLLNEVVERSECSVVLSSSWRSDTRFRPYFRKRGAKVRFHRDWRTGWISDPEPHLRGREIAEWLGRNPVERFAIVDDESDMLPEQRDRFVQTSFETGMTREHVERLVAVLTARQALASDPAGRTAPQGTVEGSDG